MQGIHKLEWLNLIHTLPLTKSSGHVIVLPIIPIVELVIKKDNTIEEEEEIKISRDRERETKIKSENKSKNKLYVLCFC